MMSPKPPSGRQPCRRTSTSTGWKSCRRPSPSRPCRSTAKADRNKTPLLPWERGPLKLPWRRTEQQVAQGDPAFAVGSQQQAAIVFGRGVAAAVELGMVAAGLGMHQRAGGMVPGHDLAVDGEMAA